MFPSFHIYQSGLPAQFHLPALGKHTLHWFSFHSFFSIALPLPVRCRAWGGTMSVVSIRFFFCFFRMSLTRHSHMASACCIQARGTCAAQGPAHQRGGHRGNDVSGQYAQDWRELQAGVSGMHPHRHARELLLPSVGRAQSRWLYVGFSVALLLQACSSEAALSTNRDNAAGLRSLLDAIVSRSNTLFFCCFPILNQRYALCTLVLPLITMVLRFITRAQE